MGDEDNLITIEDLELNLKDLEAQSSDSITITLDTSTESWAPYDTSYTIDTGSEYTFNTSDYTVSVDPQVEFEDHMPSAYRINEMCKHYPALNKAWENFKTIYKMVDQDYKGNFEDDDEIPF